MAEKTNVCTGETVQFTDYSKYSPIDWEWQFVPSSVSFANGTDQYSQNPVVIFDEADTYSVTLKVWNLNGFSESTSFDMINAGGFIPYFNENFEDGLNSRFWKVENPDHDITWEIANVGGMGHGQFAASIDLYHYFSFTQRDRLISPSFNLKGLSNASLEFDHAYAKRYSPVSDSLIVLISEDCGESWTRLLSLGDDGSGNFATHEQTTGGLIPQTVDDWCGSGYGSQCNSVNLDSYAGKSNIKIAFESYNANGNQLYIDNVKISQFVGIEDNIKSEPNSNIYPNPTNSGFTISIPENNNYEKLEIVNNFGQLVKQMPISGSKSSIILNSDNKLQKGVYFVILSGNGESKSNKLLIY